MSWKSRTSQSVTAAEPQLSAKWRPIFHKQKQYSAERQENEGEEEVKGKGLATQRANRQDGSYCITKGSFQLRGIPIGLYAV